MITYDKAKAREIAVLAKGKNLQLRELVLCIVYDQIGIDIVHAISDIQHLPYYKEGVEIAPKPFLIYKDEEASTDMSKHMALFAMDKPFTQAELKRSGLALAARIRRLFARKHGNSWVGKKPGVLSTEASIYKKLLQIVKESPKKTTYANVIAVCRAYVASCASSDFKYLMKAHYFIRKDGASQLNSYLSEGRYSPTDVIDDYEGDDAGAAGNEFVRTRFAD